jgi:hypothetical protein
MALKMMQRGTPKAAVPKAEEPKKATLAERHAAMETGEKALRAVLDVLDHEDPIDRSLGQIVTQSLANLEARRVNEARIATMALDGLIATKAADASI